LNLTGSSGFFQAGFGRLLRPDVKVVVLNYERVGGSAVRAEPAFAVFKPHFADMPSAAGYFHAYYLAVAQNIYPVIAVVLFIAAVQGSITPEVII